MSFALERLLSGGAVVALHFAAPHHSALAACRPAHRQFVVASPATQFGALFSRAAPTAARSGGEATRLTKQRRLLDVDQVACFWVDKTLSDSAFVDVVVFVGRCFAHGERVVLSEPHSPAVLILPLQMQRRVDERLQLHPAGARLTGSGNAMTATALAQEPTDSLPSKTESYTKHRRMATEEKP